jgi:hypothetical protein
VQWRLVVDEVGTEVVGAVARVVHEFVQWVDVIHAFHRS